MHSSQSCASVSGARAPRGLWPCFFALLLFVFAGRLFGANVPAGSILTWSPVPANQSFSYSVVVPAGTSVLTVAAEGTGPAGAFSVYVRKNAPPTTALYDKVATGAQNLRISIDRPARATYFVLIASRASFTTLKTVALFSATVPSLLPPPKITGLSGDTIRSLTETFIENGRDTGQPARALSVPTCVNWSLGMMATRWDVVSADGRLVGLVPGQWWLSGVGFGTTAGKVDVLDANGNVQTDATIAFWSDREIKIAPKVAFTQEQLAKGWLRVRTAAGVSAQIAFPGAIRFVGSRSATQCTGEVALQRWRANKSIPPLAYASNTKVDHTYVPTVGDAVGFGDGAHSGYIYGVSSPTTISGVRTWRVEIWDRNWRPVFGMAVNRRTVEYSVRLDANQKPKAIAKPLRASEGSALEFTSCWR